MIKRLQQALTPPRMIMEIATVNADGTVTVSTPSGFTVRAIGSGTVGNQVYVQDGRVLGIAPNLTHFDIEV